MIRTSALAMILLTAAGLGQAVAAPTHSTVERQGHDAHLKRRLDQVTLADVSATVGSARGTVP